MKIKTIIIAIIICCVNIAMAENGLVVRLEPSISGYVDAMGDLVDKESSIIKNNNEYYSFMKEDGGDYETGLSGYSLNLSLSLLYNYSTIQFGLRISYLSFSFEHDVRTDYEGANFLGDTSYDNIYSGDILSFRTMTFGPTASILLYNFGYGGINEMRLNFSLMGGKVFNGSISGVPALRDAGFEFDEEDYSSGVNGHCLGFSAGISIMLPEKINNLYWGIDFNYLYTKLDFENYLLIYNSDNTSFHSFGVSFYIAYQLSLF